MSSVFNVRWPDTSLESRLKALAAANRRSLQAEVLVALERHVALVLPAVAPGALVESEGHGAQGDPATSFSEADLSHGSVLAHGGVKQPSDSTSGLGERSGGLPSAVQVAKRPFKSDFK